MFKNLQMHKKLKSEVKNRTLTQYNKSGFTSIMHFCSNMWIITIKYTKHNDDIHSVSSTAL